MFDKLEDLLIRFDEILNELDRQQVYEDLYQWMRERM